MLSRVSRGMLREIPAHAGRMVDRLPRWMFNRGGLIVIDSSVSAIATWLAWELRFDFNVPQKYRAAMLVSVVALMLVRPACLWAMRAYRTIWRYFNLGDAVIFCLAALPPTVLMLLAAHRMVAFQSEGDTPPNRNPGGLRRVPIGRCCVARSTSLFV